MVKSSSRVTCKVESGKVYCGFMPTTLDARTHGKLRFDCKGSESEAGLQILSGSHPRNSNIQLEGSSFVPTSSRYAIGVIEEGSESMSIYEAVPFSIQALVDDVPDRKTLVDDGKTYNEKKSELINTYAPVKRQRQLRATVNAIVSDERIESFDDSLAKMKVALKTEENEEKAKTCTPVESGIVGQMRELLPPFDLTATLSGGIYDFSTLFPQELLAEMDTTDTQSVCHSLLCWIHDDFRPQKEDESKYFAEVKFVKSIMQLGRLYMASKQEKRKSFARLLNILVSMIFLYKSKRKKNWSAWDIYASDGLAQRLAELYGKEIGTPLDREGTNKLFAHICIFILRLTPFWEFDFADLKTDLNLQAKELLSMLSFCGIVVRKAAGSGILGTLKAPLVVPTSVGKGKGKGKGPK